MSQLHLPNANQARVEEKKITGYLLKSDHPVGGAKAKFFWGRGFAIIDWDRFADALLHHAQHNPISRTKTTPFAIQLRVGL